MTAQNSNFNQQSTVANHTASNAGFVDIHCHLLPAIDDGPATMADSIALCRLLVRDRIGTVVATPHQLGKYDTKNSGKIIKEKVIELNKVLAENEIPLKVLAGADVRIDERITSLIKSGEVLTVADNGKNLLLELPENILINIDSLINELSQAGVKVILTHPERHQSLAIQPQLLSNWSNKGCAIQITAGSVLGKFGSIAQKAAWQILESGLPLIVATDSHNTDSRAPCMRAAYQMIAGHLGQQTANLVCIENPARAIEGKEIQKIEIKNQEMGEYGRKPNIFRRQTAEQNR